jgi:Cof subfamily protein (haloacid dehalogenase superfamily)
MTIKLVACDLDGTLMGDDLAFSPRVLSAVRRARESGVTVTIATGRGFPSARRFARRLGLSAPLICYQGAQIQTLDGEVWREVTLPRRHLPEVVALCRDVGRELTLYYRDEIYVATQIHDRAFYERWFSLPTHRVDDLLSAVPGEPVKFIAIAPGKAEGDRLERQVRTLAAGRFQVMRSHHWFVEGLEAGVSKGASLAYLARRMGVAREEVMALGDSGNDASMVEWAGLGVAIGNASADVKAVADVIAPPQDRDGAAWALERYVLGEEGR